MSQAKRTAMSLVLGLTLGISVHSTEPDWWVQYGAVDQGTGESDYAVLNTGQLKYLATITREAMDGELFGGAPSGVDTLVDNFTGSENYSPANVGQLKAVAKVFYDALGLSYPWTASSDSDFAPANVGQAKALFSFALGDTDTDSDGLDDGWEQQEFGNLTSQTGSGDADGDGLSNQLEEKLGLDPNTSDSSVSTLNLTILTPGD